MKNTYIDLCAAESYRHPQPVTEIHLWRNGFDWPVCPRCRITIEREYQSYCDRCGQALDWDSYDRALVVII